VVDQRFWGSELILSLTILIIVRIPGITLLRKRAIPALIVPSIPARVSSTISRIVISIRIIHGWRRSRIPLVWILVHGNRPLHLGDDGAEVEDGNNENNSG
jgi:hypothetical protein